MLSRAFVIVMELGIRYTGKEGISISAFLIVIFFSFQKNPFRV